MRLTDRIPFLRGCAAGRLTGQLRPYTSPDLRHRWTTEQLIRAMDAVNSRQGGWYAPSKAKTRPWGLLGWYLKRVDPVADHPAYDEGPLIAAVDWCGHCDSPDYRWDITSAGKATPCPRCSPQVQRAAVVGHKAG